MNICIEDVKAFFNKIGFKWEGEYYSRKLHDYIIATEFNDIKYNLVPGLTSLKLYRGNIDLYLDFRINNDVFEIYNDETEIQGSGSTYYLWKDYSEQWKGFLSQKQSVEEVLTK